MSMNVKGRDAKTATVEAQNTWTDGLFLQSGEQASISVSGVVDSTVTIQRRLDGLNWRDVKQWTADAEETYFADEGGMIRIGVATGDFGSDTPVVRIGKGG